MTGISLVSPHARSPDGIFTRHQVWNKELLYIGGFLARAVYELEMQDVGAQWDASVALVPDEPLDSGLRKRFYDRAGYNLQFFTFRDSTPSAIVSSEMRSVFFDRVAQDQPFPVISTAGIRSALDVRLPDPTFSKFMKLLPTFPEELRDSSGSMVAALRGKGMLGDITFEDVLGELRERPLSEEEMIACLKWWISAPEISLLETSVSRRQLLDTARLVIESSDGGEQVIPLGGIQTFLGPRSVIVPRDGPLPSHLLPFSISRKFTSLQLRTSFQWRELTILEWVRHIVDPTARRWTWENEFNIAESPYWAERVLQVLSRCWRTLSITEQRDIGRLLNGLTCIPTTDGMMKPSQTYLPKVGYFNDVPIVRFPSGIRIWRNMEKLLVSLGVRKQIDVDPPQGSGFSMPQLSMPQLNVPNITIPRLDLPVPQLNVCMPKLHVSVPQLHLSVPRLRIPIPQLHIPQLRGPTAPKPYLPPFNPYSFEDEDLTMPDLVRLFASVPLAQRPRGERAFNLIYVFRAERSEWENRDGTSRRFRACELYEPLDVFRDLGLPVIDWRGKEGRCRWRSFSKEGMPNIPYRSWVLT